MFDNFLALNVAARWAVSPVLVFALFIVNLLISWRPSRLGNGTVWRWIWSSIVVAVVQIVPLLIYTVLVEIDPNLASTMAYSRDNLSMGDKTALVFLYSLLWSWTYFVLPGRFLNDELPPVTDPEALRDIRELSKEMQIPVPHAREYKTTAGGLAVMAWVGGLQAPTLLLSDGLLLRIPPGERRAIIAHELAHLLNHSLWYGLLVLAISGGLTVVALSWFEMSWLMVCLSGVVLHRGLSRLVDRQLEYDCDRLAGTFAGFRHISAGLEKLHAVQDIQISGWKSACYYAIATHPSLDERLAALRRASPADDRPDVRWSEKSVSTRRLTSLAAGAIWVAAIIYAMVIAPQSPLALILMSALCASPAIIRWLMIQDEATFRTQCERLTRRLGGRIVPAVSLVVLVVIGFPLLINGSIPQILSYHSWESLVLPGILLVFLIRILNEGESGHPELERSFAEQKWMEIVLFAEKFPRSISSSARNQLLLSLAHWELGEHAKATEELVQLRAAHPTYSQTWITSSLIAIEQGNYLKAIELTRQVQPQLTLDVTPHYLAARACRLLGKSEQLEAELMAIRAINPDAQAGLAVQLMLDLDRGDLAIARSTCRKLVLAAPGDPSVLLLQAELEWKAGSVDAAGLFMQRLDSILNGTSLLFIGAERAVLEKLMNGSKPQKHDSGESPA